MDNRRYARARDGDIPTIRHISHLPSFPRGFALENGQDAQPVEAFARFQIALVEMAIAEPLAEFFLRTGIFARLRRPRGDGAQHPRDGARDGRLGAGGRREGV